jgi:tetratricopeptide (TPR) repeat protein
LQDPRTLVVIDDAGNFLRTTAEKFDIISADEKTADQYASNGFSYSLEYYSLLKAHLTDDGLIIQWIPNHLPPSQYRMVLKTFADAFPHVTIWYFPAVGKGGPTNTFVVGSIREIPIDPERMNRRLEAAPEAFRGLRKYGIETAESLLAHYVAGGKAVSDALPETPHNTLENPYYEFYSPAEYAEPLNQRILQNHELLTALRTSNGLQDLERVIPGGVTDRLLQAFGAEDVFLRGLSAQLMLRPYQEVVPTFQAAVEQAPWNGNLRSQIQSYYWNKAGVSYLEGNFRDALYLMGLAAEVLPSVGEVRYYHGLALLQTGDRVKALEEMRQAIALEPRLLPPRRVLASELLAAGDVLPAVRQLEGIIAIDPEDSFALEQLRGLTAGPFRGP